MPRVLATLRVMVDAMDANQPKSLLMAGQGARKGSLTWSYSDSNGMSDRMQVADK